MRFETIRAKGIGVLRDVDVDLTSVPGKLVAVTGSNGAGKSSFLECLVGSLTRRCPTRGPLGKFATSRDAFVETRFVNGSSWTIRHALDSVSGSGESLVLDAAGAPAFDSAKRKAFDAWAAKHLPAPEVLLASTFAAQGDRGFLDMSDAERKQILLRVLGVERLEALAEIARGHARDAKTDAARLRGRLQSLSGPELAEAEHELEQAEEAVRAADAALVEARAAEEAAKAYAGTLRRLEQARRELRDLEVRRANNASLLPEADRIRGAVARTSAIRETELPTVDARLAQLAAELAEIDGQRREALARCDAARQAIAEARARVTGADRLLADEERITQAARDLPAARAALAATLEEEAAAKAAVDELANSLIDGAGKRVTGLRSALQEIIEPAEEPPAIARRAIAADDAAAKAIETGPSRLAAARAELARGAELVQSQREGLGTLERLAARAGEIEAARATRATAAEQLAAAERELEAHEATKVAIEPRRAELNRERGELQTKRQQLQAEIDVFSADVKKAPHLDAAAARIAEIDPQIAKLRAELAELEAIPAVDVETDHLAPAETRVAACRARRERAALSLEQAKKVAAEREAAEAELADVEAAVADWTLLADSLGREGLQLAEVDAACPELTALTNDLLHTCVGPRWTVTVDAARASADGKKEIAGITVRVLDTKRDREADGETLSGGERVVVNEAISLALTMLACRQAGAERPTIIRDESGAALDTENTRAWIAMLRRAAEIVGADKVLYVSHSKEAQDLADARIVVEDGKVSVAA
jgi:exonuclease SbcC